MPCGWRNNNSPATTSRRTLPTQRSATPFCRAPNARANGFHGTGLEKLDHIAAELGVTVEQDVAVGTGKRQSLAQLLYDPVAGRMLRDVEV